jgi:alpha-mannosidase
VKNICILRPHVASRPALPSVRPSARIKLVNRWLQAAVAAGAIWASLATAGPIETNAPLYLLTYDHGGLILWGTDHFAERLRNAMSWLDRYPGFKIGLDNEAYVYDYLAEHDPALLEELRSDLKKYAGRFGIGTCTYGQPLSCFINEESNIRQIAYAIKTEQKQLGCRPVIYLMSEHAMHSQIPQIVAGLGFQGALMRTHFMMYGYNPTFDLPIGWWVGLDGSRIPTVPTYPGEGAEFFKTPVDNWFLTRYPGPEAKLGPADFRKQFAHIRPLLATRADDSGLRKEDLVRQIEGNPDYHWLLLEDLLSVFPKPTADMKTLPNDFTVRMPWGYCGNEIWNFSRQAEVQALTAERLAAMELLLGGTSREAGLERAWKNLLVGQHHDIQICGLVSDARKFLTTSFAASTNVANASLQFVASRMKADGLAQVTVFNPLSWPRREWIETELVLPKDAAKAVTVRHDGQAAPCALLKSERCSSGVDARVGFMAELPPLTFAAYSISAAAEPAPPLPEEVTFNAKELRVTTPLLEVRLEPHGGIASLVDKRTGTALFAPGQRSACFAGRINGKDCESQGKWVLHGAGGQRPWATAREYGFIGDIPYTLEIRLRPDTSRLDCRVSFHFEGEKIGRLSDDPRDAWSGFVHEDKLRFKLFPATGPAALGVRDLPFAISETTNRYVEGIYWTAVADQQKGVAFFNRGTMGSVREPDGGFSLPLAYAAYYIWGTRMLTGDFTYEFALFPFAGEWRQADLHRQALAYNFPLVLTSGQPGDGTLGATVQPLSFTSDLILLSALYPDNGQVYARLFNCGGAGEATSISCLEGKARLQMTDLLGRGDQPAPTPLSFQPWQFRTLRVGQSH